LVHSILFPFSTNSAGVRALSTFKLLADSCYACSKSITVLSGPSDDAIQVDELKAIGIYVVLKLCSRDTQLDHTLFACIMSRLKSCQCWHNIHKPISCSLHIEILLALCCDLKAADYAQNYAGIIFTSLFIPCSLHIDKLGEVFGDSILTLRQNLQQEFQREYSRELLLQRVTSWV